MPQLSAGYKKLPHPAGLLVYICKTARMCTFSYGSATSIYSCLQHEAREIPLPGSTYEQNTPGQLKLTECIFYRIVQPENFVVIVRTPSRQTPASAAIPISIRCSLKVRFRHLHRWRRAASDAFHGDTLHDSTTLG